jgi:hypothetical protein
MTRRIRRCFAGVMSLLSDNELLMPAASRAPLPLDASTGSNGSVDVVSSEDASASALFVTRTSPQRLAVLEQVRTHARAITQRTTCARVQCGWRVGAQLEETLRVAEAAGCVCSVRKQCARLKGVLVGAASLSARPPFSCSTATSNAPFRCVALLCLCSNDVCVCVCARASMAGAVPSADYARAWHVVEQRDECDTRVGQQQCAADSRSSTGGAVADIEHQLEAGGGG